MQTTVEALQSLYEALGGTASDAENITTIPEMISLLSEFEVSHREEERPITSTEINIIINSID